MPNFTVEEAGRAFASLKEQGVKPAFKSFRNVSEEGKVCEVCAITALLIHRGVCTIDSLLEPSTFDKNIRTSALRELQLSEGEFWSFIYGFDNSLRSSQKYCISLSEKVMYEVGGEVRKEVLKMMGDD